ncbi:MAG TPA: DUF4260 domain-containing protein [Rhizomicrobium sp.]|nr:DUF4260 domain-containing protein [Rhizomicrobium sp.]
MRGLLRLEALALFVAAIALYAKFGDGWKLFAWLILVPDLSMLFYVFGPRAGAIAYNTMHSTLGPILAAAAGYLGGPPVLIPVALIWAAHVGIDRALGFGLKYPTAFGDTHLGRFGRRLAAA